MSSGTDQPGELPLSRGTDLPKSTLSFILPVLNESALIKTQLERLQEYRDRGHEIVIVDGGSTDGTAEFAAGLADQVLASEPGRALQMNVGAAAATGDIFVFLHIDTELPAYADGLITQALATPESDWGWFTLRLSNRALPYRLIAACMNLRTRLTFVATGDQTLFVTRELFAQIGGFPVQPLMEDVAISKRLRRKSTPNWITRPVVSSSRRWEQRGLLRSVLLMWRLRLLYFVGVSPERLHGMYYNDA